MIVYYINLVELLNYILIGSEEAIPSYVKPQIITFKSYTGETLYGTFFKGEKDDPADNPTIIYVYGGPGTRLVTNSYSTGIGQV